MTTPDALTLDLACGRVTVRPAIPGPEEFGLVMGMKLRFAFGHRIYPAYPPYRVRIQKEVLSEAARGRLVEEIVLLRAAFDELCRELGGSAGRYFRPTAPPPSEELTAAAGFSAPAGPADPAPLPDFPHVCDCGAPAYRGLTKIECSSPSCRHRARSDARPPPAAPHSSKFVRLVADRLRLLMPAHFDDLLVGLSQDGMLRIRAFASIGTVYYDACDPSNPEDVSLALLRLNSSCAASSPLPRRAVTVRSSRDPGHCVEVRP